MIHSEIPRLALTRSLQINLGHPYFYFNFWLLIIITLTYFQLKLLLDLR